MEVVAKSKFGPVRQRFENILVVKNADDLIEFAFIDRDARKTALHETSCRIFERGMNVDGVYFRARNHDRLDRRIGKFKDAVNQLLFGFVKNALGGALADQRFHLFRRNKTCAFGIRNAKKPEHGIA